MSDYDWGTHPSTSPTPNTSAVPKTTTTIVQIIGQTTEEKTLSVLTSINLNLGKVVELLDQLVNPIEAAPVPNLDDPSTIPSVSLYPSVVENENVESV